MRLSAGKYHHRYWGMAMNPDKIWESVSRIYDKVEITLWVLILLGTICFFAYTVPNFLQIWARSLCLRIKSTFVENRWNEFASEFMSGGTAEQISR